MRTKDWTDHVLAFWFGELTPEDWFNQSDALDATIRERFGELYQTLATGIPDEAASDPRVALATIIVLDQFPRNMFRGRAAAFASDNVAAGLARTSVDAGLDDALADDEKQFLYMPLMHSESRADQERCVMLFKALGREDNLKYAIEHRDVIARFGRFPHRNRALGRTSTAEEEAFLETASGYGQ